MNQQVHRAIKIAIEGRSYSIAQLHAPLTGTAAALGGSVIWPNRPRGGAYQIPPHSMEAPYSQSAPCFLRAPDRDVPRSSQIDSPSWTIQHLTTAILVNETIKPYNHDMHHDFTYVDPVDNKTLHLTRAPRREAPRRYGRQSSTSLASTCVYVVRNGSPMRLLHPAHELEAALAAQVETTGTPIPAEKPRRHRPTLSQCERHAPL